MGLKADSWIIEKAKEGMITPFVDHQVREKDGQKVISYGVCSYGYDMRLDNTFFVFTEPKTPRVRLDPKKFDPSVGYEVTVPNFIVIPAHGVVLGKSVEYFTIPENVSALCLGKSTYARCGVHVLMTPLEASWTGNVVIEIANLTPIPVKVWCQEGISQVQFYEGDEKPLVSYADRNGKYQNQTGLVYSVV